MRSRESVARFQRLVVRSLSPDLLHPSYRNHPHPLGGHCYVASESMYHLTGKTLLPYFIKHEGSSHWFLKTPGGRVVDLTADQFSKPVPYDRAIRKGFLTKRPSRRARIIIARTKNLAALNKSWRELRR
jgi:hypothetical protein